MFPDDVAEIIAVYLTKLYCVLLVQYFPHFLLVVLVVSVVVTL